MKKNRMMRLASILLVCVLLTTSVISGTYAKYVTEGTATDSARVAKFGVKVTGNVATDDTMFAKTYTNNNGQVTVEAEVDVVAPGTSGKMANFSIKGKPEVDVKVSYEATLTLGGWKDEDGKHYCPIVVIVNGTEYKGDTMDSLKAQVEKAINSYSNTYDANVELGEQKSNDLLVSWRWDFDTNDDEKDTYLGDKAAEGQAAWIKLDVICTVAQVD